MSTPLPLPRGQYLDAKNDLLHGIWDQLSLINGQSTALLEKRNARGGFGNSTEDLLYQILVELGTLATPLRNRLDTVNVKDFGAVGDGVHDDGAAILAAMQSAGTKVVLFPEGTYVSSVSLPLTNKGAASLIGAGSHKSKIVCTGNADGIALSNPADGNLGLLNVQGLRIVCGSTKAAGSTGLFLAAQHECQPGILLNDVVITTDGTHEWPICLHYKDSSYTRFNDVQIRGVNMNTGTVGVKLSNTYSGLVGRPAVNHSLNGIDVLAVGTALLIDGHGQPGIEGINLKGFRAVAVKDGIICSSADYAATWISFSHCHVECFGGQALKVSGYAQVMFDSTNLFYVHGAQANAVQFNNCINVSGDIGQIITFDLVTHAVEFSGTGGAVNLSYRHTPDVGGSKDLKVAAGITNAYFTVRRNWSGKTGVDTGNTVTDLSGYAVMTGSGEKPKMVVHTLQYITTSQTVDPSKANVFQIGNANTDVTIIIDKSKLVLGQVLHFKRYDSNSTGLITLTTSDSNNSFVQGKDSVYNKTWGLPTTAGERQATFVWNGTHLERLA